MSVFVPSSLTPQSLTWLPKEIATIFDEDSCPPWPIFALIAIRSMQLSMCGLVKQCCHPLESFNLKHHQSKIKISMQLFFNKPVAGDEVCIGNSNPVEMSFDNLHSQRVKPSRRLNKILARDKVKD
jgi:hypothetical protein